MRARQDARQLRQVFVQLEEANLFLIQNAQESAEALEAATLALHAGNAQLDAEAAELRRQAGALRGAIAAQQERARALKVGVFAWLPNNSVAHDLEAGLAGTGQG